MPFLNISSIIQPARVYALGSHQDALNIAITTTRSPNKALRATIFIEGRGAVTSYFSSTKTTSNFKRHSSILIFHPINFTETMNHITTYLCMKPISLWILWICIEHLNYHIIIAKLVYLYCSDEMSLGHGLFQNWS